MYELGNYLGGGVSGVVYEATQSNSHRMVALKILNPIGYKLTSSSTLSRYKVAVRGKPKNEDVRSGKAMMTTDHVWWLTNPRSNKAPVAAHEDTQYGGLRELPLPLCVALWGWNPPEAREILTPPGQTISLHLHRHCGLEIRKTQTMMPQGATAQTTPRR